MGPTDKIPVDAAQRIGVTLPATSGSGGGGGGDPNKLADSIHTVDGSLGDFNQYISQNFANVTPGGFFLGDENAPPTFAYKGNGDLSLATITQNALDTILTNVSIASQYQAFDTPWVSSAGKNLQLVVYFGLAMSAYPAFFALYPTLERLRNVRQLHYSNGKLPIFSTNDLVASSNGVQVSEASPFGLHMPHLISLLFSLSASFQSSSFVVSRINGITSSIFSSSFSAMALLLLCSLTLYHCLLGPNSRLSLSLLAIKRTSLAPIVYPIAEVSS